MPAHALELPSHWRRGALQQQGLTQAQRFGTGLVGTRNAIAQLGYVPIGSPSARMPAYHQTLWNRVPQYSCSVINLLLKQQQIFEYRFHLAAFLPMQDYRFALPRMAAARQDAQAHLTPLDSRLMQEILARVRGEGPLRVRDPHSTDAGYPSWWSWAPGQRALSRLFMQGELMVCAHEGGDKIYDLAERVLPAGLDLREPSLDSYARYLLDTTLRAHGLVTWKQLTFIPTSKALKQTLKNLLVDRIASGQLVSLRSKGWHGAYVDSSAVEYGAAPPQEAQAPPLGLKILSPFDNVLLHRERVRKLFQVDYSRPCCPPPQQRLCGYFGMPILYGDRLVGRIHCMAHPADLRFEVQRLQLTWPGLELAAFLPALNAALAALAAFNACVAPAPLQA
jgi:uncharacterized protein YcaQ